MSITFLEIFKFFLTLKMPVLRSPSVEFRNINVLIPSSRDQADVHRTSAFIWFESRPNRKKQKEQMLFLLFWSECRDSNSRPLEPHSSAIPNFATPGNVRLPDDFGIIAHLFKKCKSFFYFFRFIFPDC